MEKVRAVCAEAGSADLGLNTGVTQILCAAGGGFHQYAQDCDRRPCGGTQVGGNAHISILRRICVLAATLTDLCGANLDLSWWRRGEK